MSTKPIKKSGAGLRLIIVTVVIAVAGIVINFSLRPTAYTAAAYRKTALNQVTGSVTVREEYPQDLTSEAEGRLLSSELDPGKKVKKDEVVAQIDPTKINLEIERLESDYEAAEARIAVGSSTKINRDNAKDALDIAEHNYQAGGVSLSEIVKQRRQFQIIEQAVALEEISNKSLIAGLKTALKVKKTERQQMTITAPFDGQVTAVFKRPPELLAAKTPIATLITLTRTVEAKISEENFAGIKLQQKAAVKFLVYGATLYDAYVIKILPTADPETQRYVIFLDVKIEPEKLVPGITGEVSVILAERANAIQIPRRALFNNDQIYVVSDGRVQLRKVEVGYRAMDVVEILKGIDVGEQVIVEKLDKFRDGDRVRVEAVKQ